MKPLLPDDALIAGSAALLEAMRPYRVLHAEMAPPRASIRGLMRHAARLFGVPLAELDSKRRTRRIVRVRRAVAVVAYAQVDAEGGPAYSLPTIGRAMGGADHSSVIHWRDTGDELARRDPAFAWLLERLFVAGECEPLGPSARYDPQALALATPKAAGAAQPHAYEKTVPPVLVRLPESVPDEYRPRHALPLTAAMVCGEPEQADDPADVKWARVNGAAGSESLRRAVMREQGQARAA